MTLPESEVLARYRQRILHETESVCLSGIPRVSDATSSPTPISIPLHQFFGRIQSLQKEQLRTTESRVEPPGHEENEQDSPFVDILTTLCRSGERLYHQGEIYRYLERPQPTDPIRALQKYHRLVILGAPGSGKSTLLQYLARETARNAEGPVPILLPLQLYTHAMNAQEHISLRAFAFEYATGHDPELRTALEHAENILWLFDDLETNAAAWNTITSQIAAFPGEIVMTARPVGYQYAGLETFTHFEMLPMTAGEVDRFLEDCSIALSEFQSTNWDWAEEQTAWLKNQREQKSRTRALMSNPLLLTFWCAFSESEHLRVIPEQRAELYGRCVDSLLDFWGHYTPDASDSQDKTPFCPGDIPSQNARHILVHGFYYLGWYLHTCRYETRIGGLPTRKAVIETLSHDLKTTQALISSDWTRVAEDIVEFWQQTGMLVSWSHADQESCIAFRHALFREYATACRIRNLFQENFRSAWRYVFPRLHHYAWQEPLLLAIMLLDERRFSQVMTRLLSKPHPYERAIYRDLSLAVTLLQEGAACYSPFRENVLHKLGILSREYRQQRLLSLRISFLVGLMGIPTLLFLTSSFPLWGIGLIALLWIFGWYAAFVEAVFPDLQAVLALPERVWAYNSDRQPVVQLLAQCQTPEIVPHLILAVTDSRDDVRRVAVEALGKIGDKRCLPHLVRAMSDPQRNIRRIAAFAVQKIGDIPALVQALDSEQYDIRCVAAEVLGQSDSEQVLVELAQKLDDEKAYVRRLIVDILKRMGGEQVIPLLIQALADADKAVRQTAIEALGQIGIGENLYSKLRITSHLVKALNEPEPAVQWAAACALGHIRDSDTVPALIHALRKNQTYVSRAISDALQQTVTHCSVPHLVKFLKDDNAAIRQTVVMALGRIGDSGPGTILPLIELLHDCDQAVRRESVEVLGKFGNSQAVSPLLHALHDQEWCVRWAAAEALGKLGNSRATTPLLTLLNDSNHHVCRAAITALGKIGETSIVPFLIHELKSGNSAIRRAAREALTQIGEAQTVPFLLQSLKYEHDEHIRKNVEDALLQLGDRQAIPYLLEALQDDAPHLRRIAVEVLGRIGSMKTILPLIAALHDADETIRRLAANVLGKLRTPDAVPALLEVLQDQRSLVRRSVVRALGQIGEPSAVPALVELLHDADVGVRQTVVKALGQIGDPEAVPALINTLEQPDWKERWSAAYALGRIRDVRALPVLMQCLRPENDANIRRAAAEALGQIGHPLAVPALITVLADDNWFVRWAGAYALGQIGESSVVNDLMTLLRDSHEKVRWAAAEALGKIGNPQAAPALIQALKDANWDVCKAASRSLELISRAETIPRLILAMQQRRNNYVRRAAASALSHIQEEDAIPYLVHALQSHSHYIRKVAAHNLIRLKSANVIPQVLPLVRHRNIAVRACTAQIIGRLAYVAHDRKRLKQVARALWWRLTDRDSVAKAAFYALEQVANRLSVIEVEQRSERQV